VLNLLQFAMSSTQALFLIVIVISVAWTVKDGFKELEAMKEEEAASMQVTLA
jgi:hypothetical protein